MKHELDCHVSLVNFLFYCKMQMLNLIIDVRHLQIELSFSRISNQK